MNVFVNEMIYNLYTLKVQIARLRDDQLLANIFCFYFFIVVKSLWNW